jgi:hypothetical protein
MLGGDNILNTHIMDMNNLLELVKDGVGKTISSQAAIPADKKSIATSAVTSSLVNTLTSSLSGGGLTSILGGGTSGIENKITTAVSGALASKVGLNSTVVSAVTGKIVPMVMKLISSQTGKTGGGKGLVGSLVGAFKGL